LLIRHSKYLKCYIVKNTLLQTPFLVILPTGYDVKTEKQCSNNVVLTPCVDLDDVYVIYKTNQSYSWLKSQIIFVNLHGSPLLVRLLTGGRYQTNHSDIVF